MNSIRVKIRMTVGLYNNGMSKKTTEQVVQEANNYAKILCENQNLNYVLVDVRFCDVGPGRGTWALTFQRWHDGYRFTVMY